MIARMRAIVREFEAMHGPGSAVVELVNGFALVIALIAIVNIVTIAP